MEHRVQPLYREKLSIEVHFDFDTDLLRSKNKSFNTKYIRTEQKLILLIYLPQLERKDTAIT
jgi:hypothetical protein